LERFVWSTSGLLSLNLSADSQFLTFSAMGRMRKVNFLKKERSEKEKVIKSSLIDAIAPFV